MVCGSELVHKKAGDRRFGDSCSGPMIDCGYPGAVSWLGRPSYGPVVTRLTTGRKWQHFPDEETDGAHVDGRSNTGWTDSNTLPR